jgi:hypothetical protein
MSATAHLFVFACVIHTACFWIGLLLGVGGPLGIAWRWSGVVAALLAASHGAGRLFELFVAAIR